MVVFWMMWGMTDPSNKKTRARLLALVFVTPVVIGIARLLVILFPYKTRPIHTPGLDVNLIYPEIVNTLNTVSSFPSDHAVLFFSIAASLFMINRVVGIIAFLHAILVISLPRVLIGLHWPGDILAGALIGIALSVILLPLATRVIHKYRWADARIAVTTFVYPLMFLITFQIATLFEASRDTADALANFIFNF